MRLLLEKFHANVIAISRTRTQELVQLGSDSLMVIACDVSVCCAIDLIDFYLVPL